MLGMLSDWLVRKWGGMFSTVRCPDWAVCLRMTVTTKLGVFAIGAVGAALELNGLQTCSGRVAWLCLIRWGRFAIDSSQVVTGVCLPIIKFCE